MLIDITKFNLYIKGIVHIGAYIGEEQHVYTQMNIDNVLFFEPLDRHCKKLKERLGNVNLIQCALGNYDGETTINISATAFNGREWYQCGDGASSSILQPEKHLSQHPNITFMKTVSVPIHRLDTLVEQQQVDPLLYNMINIDIQGYELEALKGAAKFLKNIDYILCEVNQDEVYQNCARVEEIDLFLLGYGLKRIETNWAGGIWGDALYVKDEK